MPRLSIQIPDAEEAVYEFDETEVSIGRTEDNSIMINHDSLSSQHARLVQNGDGDWSLADLGSTNGTFINGSQITEALLPDESEILFGQVPAHFSLTASAEAPQEEYHEETVDTLGTTPLEVSGRPANFTNISPLPKSGKKKDPVAIAVLALAGLAVVIAIALAAVSFTTLA